MNKLKRFRELNSFHEDIRLQSSKIYFFRLHCFFNVSEKPSKFAIGVHVLHVDIVAFTIISSRNFSFPKGPGRVFLYIEKEVENLVTVSLQGKAHGGSHTGGAHP